MFINPKVAIAEGWITGIENQDVQVQPNAIDFTLDRLFYSNADTFVISKDPNNPFKELKQMRSMEEHYPIPDRRYPDIHFFHIQPKHYYDALSNVYVDIPQGVAAQLIIRSTFNRNGMFLTSGLYDSGYKGHVGFGLHNNSIGVSKIQQGTRIGQIIFIKSDNAGVYSGGYNHEQGTGAVQHT